MTTIEDQTLVGINSALFRLEGELAESSDIVSATREDMMAAKRALDQARASAYLDAKGTVAEREARVLLACAEQIENLDVATAAFEYAKSHAMGLRDTLSALQTRSANLRKEIDLAR